MGRREGRMVFLSRCVVEVLTDSADPKQYIKKMRTRDPELNASWGTICTLTRMTASDGKTTKQYKQFKGLKKESLRDNMTNLEPTNEARAA